MKKNVLDLCLVMMVLSVLQCHHPVTDLMTVDAEASQQGLGTVLTDGVVIMPSVGHVTSIIEVELNDIRGWRPQHAVLDRSEAWGLTWGTVKSGERVYATVWRQSEGRWNIVVQLGLVDTLRQPAVIPMPSQNGRPLQAVFETDRQFAALAESAGMAAAFAEYIDEHGVAAGGQSLSRHEDFRTRAGKDLNFKLRWEPQWGELSPSGEMAVTVGYYTSAVVQDGVEQPRGRGYYCSVWHKNESGDWRFIFDGGSELLP